MISRWCREEKAVVVVVYAERSRRPRPREDGRSRDHHFHRFRRNEGGSYNRRAELLGYATHLRASSSSTRSSSANSHPLVSHHSKQHPTHHQVSRVDRRQKVSGYLETWECLIPSFLRNSTNKDKRKKNVSFFTTKMKVIVKSLEVQKKKKGNFMSQLWKRVKKRS